MRFRNASDVRQLTAEWLGRRSADGRPQVSEEILRRMVQMTTEEAWAVIERQGYRFQFEGGLACPASGSDLGGAGRNCRDGAQTT